MGNLPPTFRFPFNTDPDTFPEGEDKGWRRSVHQAIRYAFSGLLDLNQAVPAILAKITASPASSSGATGGNVIGTVNDQTGQTSYVVQQSDYGAMVIVNNGGGVQVGLNALIEKPFYVRIKVDSGSGSAVITPGAGTINHAGFIIVGAGSTKDLYFNSLDFNWTAS
jgi:hypothetical protein